MTIWSAAERGGLRADALESCVPLSYAPCDARPGAPSRTVIARVADVDEDALFALLKEGPFDRGATKIPTFTESRLQPEPMKAPADLAPLEPQRILLAIAAATILSASLLLLP